MITAGIVIPGLSLRSNPGLKLANAFGVFIPIQTDALPNNLSVHKVRVKQSAILSPVEQQELIKKIKRLPQDRVAEVEAFIDSLSQEPGRDRTALDRALSDYAIQHAGTAADLDPDLEAAATDHLHFLK